jgi:hypothetical protein
MNEALYKANCMKKICNLRLYTINFDASLPYRLAKGWKPTVYSSDFTDAIYGNNVMG